MTRREERREEDGEGDEGGFYTRERSLVSKGTSSEGSGCMGNEDQTNSSARPQQCCWRRLFKALKCNVVDPVLTSDARHLHMTARGGWGAGEQLSR